MTLRTMLPASAVTFLAAGALSGRLLEQGGAHVWLLRTLVVIAAAVVVVLGLVAAARVRRLVRRRVLGWAAAAAAVTAFAWLVAVPVVYAVYLSHLPARRAVPAADLGVRTQPVAIRGDGVTLRGWYVPSRNGATVIALHGTGGNRASVARHARLLAAHGYGVLALDLRGHGESGGRSTSLPWRLDDDLDGALDWLAARGAHRIGVLGVSLGGEVALQLAARRADVRAVVAEGVMGSTAADAVAAGSDPLSLTQLTVLSGANVLLAGGGSAPNGELVERIAPRPLLLISSGASAEARANRAFARRGAQHWNVRGAAHGAALRADPAGYERRVIGFLDATLAP